MSTLRIGIIGTAGRDPDNGKMTKELFDSMLATTRRIIKEQTKLDYKRITLISGGAAWSGEYSLSINFCTCIYFYLCRNFMINNNRSCRR